MKAEEKVARQRLSVLELAETLWNVFDGEPNPNMPLVAVRFRS